MHVRRGDASLFRRVAIILVCAFGAMLAVCASGGQIWAHNLPDLALRLWPVSAEAMAQRASVLLTRPDVSATQRREAERLSTAAIARDTANVVGIRNRMLLAGYRGNVAGARRWASHGEALSRRDLGIQLWLIEDAVRRGEIDDALTHYDHALRTSKESAEILFPVLIAAANETEVADKLSRLVAARPNWWGPFMNRLIGEAQQPSTLDLFARRLRLSPTDPEHPDFFARTLQRMALAGDFFRADALYRSIRSGSGRLVQDGEFEQRQSQDVLPFAWRLVDEPDLGARIEPRPDGAPGHALLLDARNGRSGEVAVQAAALHPGDYLLRATSARIRDIDSAPIVQLRCGSVGQRPIAAFRLRPTDGPARSFAIPFTVPVDCPGVWIAFLASAGLSGDVDSAWIDDVSIIPQPAKGVILNADVR